MAAVERGAWAPRHASAQLLKKQARSNTDPGDLDTVFAVASVTGRSRGGQVDAADEDRATTELTVARRSRTPYGPRGP